MTFKQVMAAGGPMTLGVIFGLQVLDSVDGSVFSVFAPEIRNSLGVSSSAIATIAALAGVMVAFGAVPLGVLADRRRRTTIAGVSTLVWAASTAFFSLSQNLWQLTVVRILAGIGKANEGPIQTALLTDTYPATGRGRVLGIHRSGQPVGIVAGPLVATVFAALIPEEHEPWRWAFGFLALPALLLGLAALRLPEPPRGGFERRAAHGGGPLREPTTKPLPLLATFGQLKKIRTFYLAMLSLGAFGLSAITVPNYLSFILEDHLHQGVTARGVIITVSALGGLVGAGLGGAYGDRLFSRSPKASLYVACAALATLGIGLAVQVYSPNVATFIVVGMITQGMVFAGIVTLSLVVAAVIPAAFRSTAFAVVSLYLAVVGGLGGAVLVGIAEGIWGVQAAIAVIAPTTSVVAGLLLLRSRRHLLGDMARAAAGVIR
ncbi:MFS transporter [Saccharothrix coeruleofusca]|uniref:Major facilitator superfamily (MFS) profile domain-containing protein n=1 Tax=Saccharothrix coeruleofusca TaxID=33919 RepID=A0A918AQR4_9PSEU|nr:MFS transporter [Saccharothrix coeruleofusca]MBP2335315.1 MFS family permease [Saccharothrix coeruleofusca]GGP72127.1 hypothetical protein GCM10010185_51910 [Saccharothrix coeruleofusca]